MERRRPTAVATLVAPDEPLAPGTVVTVGEDAVHHLRVRRLEVGARVSIVNGCGLRGEGSLVQLARATARVELDAVLDVPSPAPIHALVPVADRERMLWLAEKVTELGVASWRPVLWRRSRSVAPRGEGISFHAKVRSRMTSALEQSGGAWMPLLYPEATAERAVDAARDGTRLLLDRGGEPMLARPIHPPVVIAVGPEGGIEPDERRLFEDAGFRRVALGEITLRFETAAVAATAVARAALDLIPGGSDG